MFGLPTKIPQSYRNSNKKLLQLDFTGQKISSSQEYTSQNIFLKTIHTVEETSQTFGFVSAFNYTISYTMDVHCSTSLLSLLESDAAFGNSSTNAKRAEK